MCIARGHLLYIVCDEDLWYIGYREAEKMKIQEEIARVSGNAGAVGIIETFLEGNNG